MPVIGTLYRTFEFLDHKQIDRSVETRITFTFRRGDPGKYYGEPGDCYPAEPAEWEFDHAEREIAPRNWVRLLAGEWLEDWCKAALSEAEEYEICDAVPERDPDDMRDNMFERERQ